MSLSEFLIAFTIATILSIFAIIITWKVSDFFISSAEYFFKSRYEIILTKLGMCATIVFIIFVLTFKLMDTISPNKSKVIISTSNSTNTNNYEQFNSNKTENDFQNFSNYENEESFKNNLKMDTTIIERETTISTKHQEDLDNAIEMLKRDKSVREIADSTSLTKKEIRQLRRELRKKEQNPAY